MMVGEETIENPRKKMKIGSPVLRLNGVSSGGDSTRTSLNRTGLTNISMKL
jgi:hypothetical protein